MDASELDFGKLDGLIPAVIQNERTGRILMLGFMNREALDATIETGKATFWSRTRKKLWCKGETSGNFLIVKSIHTDCDKDSVVVLVEPEGPACHEGTTSCFFEDNRFVGPEFLVQLSDIIRRRHQEMPEGSYTTRLFTEGMTKIAKKVGEEAVEVVVSAHQEKQRSVEESADLLYHLLVFLEKRGIALSEVMAELEQRHSERQPPIHQEHE